MTTQQLTPAVRRLAELDRRRRRAVAFAAVVGISWLTFISVSFALAVAGTF